MFYAWWLNHCRYDNSKKYFGMQITIASRILGICVVLKIHIKDTENEF